MNKVDGDNRSLSDLLGRISVQMDGLASEVHRIEHAVGDELALSGPREAETITRLQRLDFLRQSMEDLALLFHFLSRDHDGVHAPDLASKLHLDVTKALVDDNWHVDTTFMPNEKTIGDVDLF